MNMNMIKSIISLSPINKNDFEPNSFKIYMPLINSFSGIFQICSKKKPKFQRKTYNYEIHIAVCMMQHPKKNRFELRILARNLILVFMKI